MDQPLIVSLTEYFGIKPNVLPSAPNAISANNINQELGRASPFNQQVSLNDTAVRNLFGKPTNNSTISFADGLGKSATYTIDLLIVGGGGAGGSGGINSNGSGGGGAGGVVIIPGLAISTGRSYGIVVGAGGTPISNDTGNDGNNSSAFGYIAVGGGGGAGDADTQGRDGGSGGGSRRSVSNIAVGGGNSTQSSLGYGLGNAGGRQSRDTGSGLWGAGGGGGAGGTGGSTNSGVGGAGGAGVTVAEIGFTCGGGGGGGSSNNSGGGGGTGGGGSRGSNNGSANTGGGGGGANAGVDQNGGSGGSGTVRFRYSGSPKHTSNANYTVTEISGFTYITFNNVGSFTFVA